MNNIRWYKSLHDKEFSPGLLSNTIINKDTLIISQERAERQFNYAAFNNYIHFAMYFKKIASSHQCFYELIDCSKPHKLFFDIDVKEDVDDNTFNKFKNIFIERIMFVNNNIQKEQIMLFESKSNNSSGFIEEHKKSLHVIVYGWFLLNNKHTAALATLITEHIPSQWQSWIDLSVYSSRRSLRLFNNHKWNSDRVKLLDPLSPWQPSKSIGKMDPWPIILGASLVGNISDCNFLGNYYVEPPKLLIENIENVNEDIVDRALQLCKIMEKSENLPYKIRDIQNNLILLDRTAPSYCITCQRVHDNENPQIKLFNSRLYWHCRRQNKATYIGSIHYNNNHSIDLEKDDNTIVIDETTTIDRINLFELLDQNITPINNDNNIIKDIFKEWRLKY